MIETPVQYECLGPNSIGQLSQVLARFEFDSLFLVTGQKSFEQPAILTALEPSLAAYPYARFSDFRKNPELPDLETGIAFFRALKRPLILAIGGGSVLDMAKLIGFFGGLDVEPKTWLMSDQRLKVSSMQMPPFVAVPTTAGTGSEATQFATIYIESIKYSLDEPAILPNAVILDPSLTLSLPAKETRESGLDALTQAIESYWSVRANATSRQYAQEAIPMLHTNLETAVLAPDLDSRSAMLQGANLAGKAINMTRTTAAHAISYPMTAHFGISHGQAVSISLPYFLTFNAAVTEDDVLDVQGVSAVTQHLNAIVRLLGYSSIVEARIGLIALMKRIGAATTLKELSIAEADRELIIRDGFNPQRVRNNPRALTESQLRALLSEFGE